MPILSLPISPLKLCAHNKSMQFCRQREQFYHLSYPLHCIHMAFLTYFLSFINISMLKKFLCRLFCRLHPTLPVSNKIINIKYIGINKLTEYCQLITKLLHFVNSLERLTQDLHTYNSVFPIDHYVHSIRLKKNIIPTSMIVQTDIPNTNACDLKKQLAI